jgi:hypothetical protein
MANDIKIEDEPSMRYRISYWGEVVGRWDTAKEAIAGYREHYRNAKPIIDNSPKARREKPSYAFVDNREVIDVLALAKAAKAEDGAN